MKKLLKIIKNWIESPLRRRQERLQRERNSGLGEKEFVRSLAALGVSELVGKIVYKHLQECAVIDEFVVRPEDSLYGVFGILDEDVDAVFDGILRELSVCVDPSAKIPSYLIQEDPSAGGVAAVVEYLISTPIDR